MTAPAIDYRCVRNQELTAWTRRPLLAWLAPRELDELQSWRDASRRGQWLAGRALVKQLVLERFPQAASEAIAVEVRSLQPNGKSTRPALFIAGRPIDCSISLAHTEQAVTAALCVTSGFAVGIDLVPADRSEQTLASRWFTPAEQKWMRDRNVSTSVMWAAKEAIYKAIGQGEPFTPETIEILAGADDKLECRYHRRPLLGDCSLHVGKGAGHCIVLAVVAALNMANFERSDFERAAVPGEVAHVS